jgi:osmoprotectant transport system permease protein
MDGELLSSSWRYVTGHGAEILAAFGQHLVLVAEGSLFSVALGLGIGIPISRNARMRRLVIGFSSVLSMVPIIALFGILITIMGIGTRAVVVALTIYSILPVLQNTTAGLCQVGVAEREAALGMGTSRRQLLFRVELPLAFPVIFAGIRTSIVMNFSIATYAVFIGGGGMGSIIMQGLRTYNDSKLLVGTLLVAVGTIGLDRLIGRVEAVINHRYGFGRAARR